MKLKSLKSNNNNNNNNNNKVSESVTTKKTTDEDWSGSASVHSGLASALSAYSQLKTNDPDSAVRYGNAYNSIAWADALLGATDSINSISDESQMAQKMQQLANLSTSVNNSIKSNYSSLMSLITGSKGSLPSQLAESDELSEELIPSDNQEAIKDLITVARNLLSRQTESDNKIAQMLYIIIDVLILESSSQDDAKESLEIMLQRLSDALGIVSGELSASDEGSDEISDFLVSDDSDSDDQDGSIYLSYEPGTPSESKEESLSLALKEVEFKGGQTEGPAITLYQWEANRRSFAEKAFASDKTTKRNYTNDISQVLKYVMKSFPKEYRGIGTVTKMTPGDILVASRDTLDKTTFSGVASIANHLHDLHQVGMIPTLSNTEIWAGIDPARNKQSIDEPYALMITKGQVISVFYLNPDVFQIMLSR